MNENLSFGGKSIIILQSNFHRQIFKNSFYSKLINFVESASKLKKDYILKILNKNESLGAKEKKESFFLIIKVQLEFQIIFQIYYKANQNFK